MVFGVFKLRCNVFVAGTFVTLCSTMNTALDVFEEELTRKQKQPVADDKETTVNFKRRREAYLKQATPIANMCWSGPTPVFPDVEPDVEQTAFCETLQHHVLTWFPPSRSSPCHLKRRLQFHNDLPAVEQPAVEQSVVEQPAVEQPVVEQPAVEQPAVELPAVEQPAVELPAVEQSVVEQPAVELPTVELPVVEQSVVEQPAVELPTVKQSAVEQSVVEQPTVEQSVVEQDDEEHIFDVSIPSFLQKTGYVRRDFDFAKKFDPKHFQLVVKKGDSASTRVSVHEGPTLKDVIVAGTTLEILGEAFDVGPPPLLNQNHVFLNQNCNVETQCHFFSRFKLATLHRGPDEGSHATVSAGQRKRWEEGGFHGYRPILFSEEKSQPPTG